MKKTKMLSLFLAAAMVITLLPARPAAAAEAETATEVEAAEVETAAETAAESQIETETAVETEVATEPEKEAEAAAAAEATEAEAEMETAEINAGTGKAAKEVTAMPATADTRASEYGVTFDWEDEQGNIWHCAPCGEMEAAVFGVSNAVMELEIPEIVADETGGYKVTQVIGRRELYDSYSYQEWFDYEGRDPDYELLSITFPDSVEYIGEAAFGSAFLINNQEPTPYIFLKKIELPQNPVLEIGEHAFKGCISLEEIIFKTSDVIPTPQPVKIGRYAFKKCIKLKSITFPDYTEIGEFAFEGCNNLEEVLNIPGEFTYYLLNSKTCLLNHISFSDKAEEVGGVTCYAWSNGETGGSEEVEISGISQVTIPAGVKSVSGFSSFVNLNSVSLPEGLEEIGWGAFENCKQLSSINIPSSVTRIDDYAFYGCSALHISIYHPSQDLDRQYTLSGITDITISGETWNIYWGAFWGCYDLQSITINNPQYGYHTVDGALYRETSTSGNCLMVYPAAKNYGSSITIPDHADAIDGGAFYGAAFSEIHIPHRIIRVIEEYNGDTDSYILPFDYMRSHCKIYYFDDPDLDDYGGYLQELRSFAPGNNAAAGGEVIDHEWIAEYVAVESISLYPISLSLKVDEESQLKAQLTPSYASNKNVTWSVANNTIASVSADGLVKGLKAGQTTVSVVSADGNKKASCKITVKSVVEPTSMKLSSSLTSVEVGKKVKLTATYTPTYANPTLTWTSSDTARATVDSDGRVSGKKVGTVTITAKTSNGLTASCKVSVLFTDVPATGAYYSTPVYWAVDKGITNGYTDSDGLARTFMPGNNCTREAVVTFLWRLAGKPNPKSMVSKFSDVQDSSKYYYKAVLWAAEKGITSGYSDGTFRPGDTCLREHVVTFLWRYAGKPSVSMTNTFTDVKSSDYYYKAVLWAAKNNITKGYSDDNFKTFRPKLDCLREHVVTFLYRYATLK